MTRHVVIHWFRQDLRLADNPALAAAAKAGHVLPIYILDDTLSGMHQMGGASRWWLYHSLRSLNKSLKGRLVVVAGEPQKIIPDLVEQYKARSVYWNRCYEPWRVARDTTLKESLVEQGIEVQSFNGSLLWEPWEVLKSDGTPYKVFTPFYRRGCMNAAPPREPLPVPELSLARMVSAPVDALGLMSTLAWGKKLEPYWHMGEHGAKERLETFLDTGLPHYKEGRNLPAKPYVSRLSPYLHVGEISPNQVWWAVRLRGDDPNIDCFCSELGWREFSYHMLYHNPTLPVQNLQRKFDDFLWRNDEAGLRAWQRGQTGIPIVDAGMRELWQTGVMHNRVRMIVGSFLVKNLLLHWHHGERWFWDCLVDADLASNSASWQWVAGCGADAAPFFRIFNPVTQGQKFDANGEYTRRFVPELARLPNKYLFNPWEAPADVLKAAGVELGVDYPIPIVDIKKSRNRALSAYRSIG